MRESYHSFGFFLYFCKERTTLLKDKILSHTNLKTISLDRQNNYVGKNYEVRCKRF